MPLNLNSFRRSSFRPSSAHSTTTNLSGTSTANVLPVDDPATLAQKSDLIFLSIDTVVLHHSRPIQRRQSSIGRATERKFFFEVQQNGGLNGVTKQQFKSGPASANTNNEIEWKINREIAVSGTEIFLQFYMERIFQSKLDIGKVDLLDTAISLNRESLIEHKAFTLETNRKEQVTIHLKSEALEKLLGKIAAPSSVMTSLDKTKNTLNLIMKVADSLSELNPIAKVVVSLLSKTYENVKDQDVCYQEVADLLEKMNNMYPYIERAKDLWLFENLQGVIKKLLDLYKETLAIINGHNLLKGRQQLFRFMFSSTQKDTYKSLADRFDMLSEEFDRCLKTDWAANYQKEIVDSSLKQLAKVKYVEANGCDPGTREEVLQTLTQWLTTPSPSSKRIFWLLGEEGTGKTTTSVTVFRNIRDNRKESYSALTYYTFSLASEDVARNNALNFLPTICHQLCRHSMNYGVLVSRHLDTQPFFLTSTGHLETQFLTLFCVPLERLVKRYGIPKKPWVLIIDGLDHCGTPTDRDIRAEIVSYLLVMQEQWSWFKIVLTSRENPDFDWFNRIADSALADNYRFTIENSREDVWRYLELHLPRLLSSGFHPDADDEGKVKDIIAKLTENCKGSFKEAHRMCEHVRESLDVVRAIHRVTYPDQELPEINLFGHNENLGKKS